MAYTSEANFLVTVRVGGTDAASSTDIGTFDGFDGGEIDSEAKTVRPGGMGDPVPMPAPPTTGEVTVKRFFDADLHGEQKLWLNGQIGRFMSVTKTPLRADKSRVTKAAETFTGVLKGVSTPTHDSEGDSVTELVLTLTVGSLPSGSSS